MIKEEKQSRYNGKKTVIRIFTEYAKTIGISFLVAFVFTLLLSIHARSEMIKNLYVNVEQQ